MVIFFRSFIIFSWSISLPQPAQPKIDIPKNKIVDFCRRWKVSEFALFGSVLSNNFGPNSDTKVDLVSRRGLEASRNYLRRNATLKSAQVLQVA